MASFSFSLRAALGLLPKTENIESQQKQLFDEYNKMLGFTESEILAEYYELDKLINSNEFKNLKSEILNLNYKNTKEYTDEIEYQKLKKNNQIINYFKVLNSDDYKKFSDILNSADLTLYNELTKQVGSQEHINEKNEMQQMLKSEQQKKQTYIKQKKQADIKNYYSFLNSAQYKLYTELNQSDELTNYIKLDEFVKSSQLAQFKLNLANELKTEQNKPKELSALKKLPEVKAYNKAQNKDEITEPEAILKIKELETYINSNNYKQKLASLDYKNTDEYKNEQKYIELKKSSKFKNYFKIAQSQKLSTFNSFSGSNTLAAFIELELYINSEAYTQKLKTLDYTNCDGYKNEQQLNNLKHDSKIKFYLTYSQSKQYKLFEQTSGSDILKRYNELDELVNSEKFIAYKQYMLDKNKFDKTEHAQNEKRYNELKNSDEIKWYLSVKDSDKFNEIKLWNLVFEDDFTAGKIDTEKWMNSFFWGKMLLNDRYVMAGDKQYFTDNKNVELNGTTLKIITKQENTTGKVWHPLHGFNTQNFNYTSGMLSTAHSFRQKYGRFEAKIKLNSSFPVYQAFWLKGEKIMPEIDVVKFNMDKKNRLQVSSICGDVTDLKSAKKITSKLNGSYFTDKYFIYTIDWLPEKISWKINNTEIFSTTEPIPDEPMYIMLSSGLQANAGDTGLPAAFEIDWVRCYEKVL